MEQNKDRLSKQAREQAEFFDKLYTETDKRNRAESYFVPEYIIREVTNPGPRPLSARGYSCSLLGNLRGKNLLDYGAGDGWNTVCFAKAGARVRAIDISEKGIELTRKKAAANGVGELVTAEVRDCYKTTFESDMFDLIYGHGILHHLDLPAAGREISRILRPGGVAVFCEPIRETKVMDLLKAIVLRLMGRKPSELTEAENPLTMGRISALTRHFGVVNCRMFEVLSSAGALTKSTRLRRFLLRADDLLMRCLPGFQKLGRAVVIELRQPLKSVTSGQ
jgi:2-polyprenyl-3-methyl-5-hydroxy-6-metoxy-1,4-benzoquinol methylase